MAYLTLECPRHGTVYAELRGRQTAGALSPANHDVWCELVAEHEDCQ